MSDSIAHLKHTLSQRSGWELASHVISASTIAYFAYRIFVSPKESLLGFVVSNPIAKGVINSQVDKQVKETIESMFPDRGVARFAEIPHEGNSSEIVLEMLRERKVKYNDLQPGKCRHWAYVYNGAHGDAHTRLTEDAYNLFLHTNVLNPMVFSSLRDMENEVVRMTANLLHGDSNTVGTMTSGGTESLLLMLKTYRDYAAEKRSITQPEILLPITAHPAMAKAAQYFNVRMVFVDVDPITHLPDPQDYEKLITSNTVVVVASAPQYPHGVIDPITQIARVAQKHNVPMHVDACIGGYILPWIEKLGRKVEPWDFRVEGVTSISTDCHKFAYCDKGASVLAFRSRELRRFQFSVFAGWPGGLYVSPSMMGSRGGGPIASAWASMVALGENGFLERTKKVVETFDYITTAIREMSHIDVVSAPVGFIIAFKSTNPKELHIFALADVLEQRGWQMERQQNPDTIHCTLMPQHAAVKEQFVADLRECIHEVVSNPDKYNKSGTAAMYGSIAELGALGQERIGDKGFLTNFLTSFADYTYTWGG